MFALISSFATVSDHYTIHCSVGLISGTCWLDNESIKMVFSYSYIDYYNNLHVIPYIVFLYASYVSVSK